jgi:hypothetical protein
MMNAPRKQSAWLKTTLEGCAKCFSGYASWYPTPRSRPPPFLIGSGWRSVFLCTNPHLFTRVVLRSERYFFPRSNRYAVVATCYTTMPRKIIHSTHKGIAVTVQSSVKPGFFAFRFQIGNETFRGLAETKLAWMAVQRARRAVDRRLRGAKP